MRLLLIHADYLEFEAKQPTPAAEPLPEELKRGRAEEVLVAFAAVEEADEVNPEAIAERAAEEIASVLERVGARAVVLYPYAHLSSSLASPRGAVRVLELTRGRLLARGLEVLRLPFGWYKAFRLSCKGHPLSELSRTITAEAAAAPREARQPSEYLVVTPSGEEHRLDLDDVEACEVLREHPLLKQFVLSEELGVKSGEEPPHVGLMRRLELVDREPASDVGHLRFYPKGALVKGLLEDLAVKFAEELGAVRIETPALYKADEPDISEQASRFLQREYKVELPGKSLLLRFAGDFGLFRMMRDAVLSYRHLPLRVFELSPSYRLEQSGECVGLKRLRAFTMPDVHCFCRDLEQGLEEYERLFLKYAELLDAMGVEYVVAFRVVKEFYESNKGFIAGLLERIGKPALIELLPERRHYWVMKHELQAIDSVGGNAQLATVQLDVEDSERYGIFYVDERGERKGCIILHSSMGSIERWIYALLETAAKRMREGGRPSLPLWLSPTQVRLCPVNESLVPFAEEVASKLEAHGIRVDVDDRGESVARKVRDAEVEWVNAIVVVGERERETGRFQVRLREEGRIVEMGLEELASYIEERTKGYPFRPLPLPRPLSRRPAFVG